MLNIVSSAQAEAAPATLSNRVLTARAKAARKTAIGVGEVIRRLRGSGVLSAADLMACGISRQYASQLRQRGILVRVAHGASRLAPRFELI
jgi:acetylornithine/succinyldiaminopimelate/putrescine aminotransferase